MRTRTAITIGVMAFLVILSVLLFVASMPAGAADVCPEAGKVEANGGNQDSINDLVLDAGTVVCIKGGQVLVTVTADGVKTLFELLGANKDVSHYTIIEEQTTTTTEAPSTTTTTNEPPSTTAGPTTTVTESTSTTTTISDDQVEPTVTTAPASATTSTSTPTVTRTELPYTGLDPTFLGGLAALLGSTGAFLVRKGRR